LEKQKRRNQSVEFGFDLDYIGNQNEFGQAQTIRDHGETEHKATTSKLSCIISTGVSKITILSPTKNENGIILLTFPI
jgi:hypothetical protein